MMDTHYWRLEVSYPYQHRKQGWDKQIEAAVGRPSDDSGGGFGMRDIGWAFEVGDGEDEQRVKEAQARVQQLNLPGVETDVWSLKRVE